MCDYVCASDMSLNYHFLILDLLILLFLIYCETVFALMPD